MSYIDQIQVGTTTYDIIDTNGRILTENKLNKVTSYSSGNIITINNPISTSITREEFIPNSNKVYTPAIHDTTAINVG